MAGIYKALSAHMNAETSHPPTMDDGMRAVLGGGIVYMDGSIGLELRAYLLGRHRWGPNSNLAGKLLIYVPGRDVVIFEE